MLKIVKSQVYRMDRSKPVELSISEAEKEETEKEPEAPREITPEEAEIVREQEKKKRREEEVRRFNDAVRKCAEELVNRKKAAFDAEYERIVSSAKTAADKMLEDAREKTKAAFAAAEEECEKLKEQSRKEGFEAGFEVGKADGVKQCDKYLEAVARLLEEINSRKESYYIRNEYEMTRTVLDMVQKITCSEIKTDPSVIDRICVNAARNFRNSDYLKISVCEGEASKEFVTDGEFVKSLIPFIPEIEVEELSREDAPSGTIVLDNGSEIIDASVPTQLEFLKEIMRNSRGEKPENTDEVE